MLCPHCKISSLVYKSGELEHDELFCPNCDYKSSKSKIKTIPTAELLESINKLTEERDMLKKLLAAEKERADYAWKNTKIIDKARIEAEQECKRLKALIANIAQMLSN